jgi:hypothetical protein
MYGYHNPYGSFNNGQQQPIIQQQQAAAFALQQQQQQQFILNDDNLKRTSSSRQQLILSNNTIPLINQQQQLQKQTIISSNTTLNEIKKDSTSSSSSSYVPQVEAISPTPDDQKENTHLQEYKDKIISELNQVEKDLNCSDYQVKSLKRKLIESEEAFNKPVDNSSCNDKTLLPITLGEKIYVENRVRIFCLDFFFFFKKNKLFLTIH